MSISYIYIHKRLGLGIDCGTGFGMQIKFKFMESVAEVGVTFLEANWSQMAVIIFCFLKGGLSPNHPELAE